MPDETQVPEYYADLFEVVGNPYGSVLNFYLSSSDPRVATKKGIAKIRMSWEHAKAIAFILQRQIKAIEKENKVVYPIPPKVLSEMAITTTEWDQFWKTPKKK